MNAGKKLLKSLGKELGWLLFSRTVASLKGDSDIRTLHRRFQLYGNMALMFAWRRRRILFSNLAAAFPEWNEAQIRTIGAKVIGNICKGFVDSFYYSYHPKMLFNHIILEENGVLEALLAQGEGCIVATGHIGLFPFLGMPIVARGAPFGPIVRDAHDKRVKDAFDDARKRVGYTLISDRPPITVMKKSLGLLRSGGGVMIAFDMHPAGRASTNVTFLGRKTPMFNFMIRLAAKTGAPLVRGHVLREPDGLRHRVTYYPPIAIPRVAADPDSPAGKEFLQGLVDWLSGVIRNHPEQYWWIHRRWREWQDNQLKNGR